MKNLLLGKLKKVLDAVCSSPEPLPMHILAEKLDIPLATLSRLVADLVEIGLVEKSSFRHVVPAPGMIRLGEAARENSLLVHHAAPLIRSFAEKNKMNGLLAGFDEMNMFPVFSCGATPDGQRTLWETGLAMVIMTEAGLTDEKCIQLYRENNPGYTDTSLLLFERELSGVRQSRTLFRVNTMRQWSCSLPFRYHDLVCGLCFYGRAPEGKTMERFSFDCSLLVSRITSNFQ